MNILFHQSSSLTQPEQKIWSQLSSSQHKSSIKTILILALMAITPTITSATIEWQQQPCVKQQPFFQHFLLQQLNPCKAFLPQKCCPVTLPMMVLFLSLQLLQPSAVLCTPSSCNNKNLGRALSSGPSNTASARNSSTLNSQLSSRLRGPWPCKPCLWCATCMCNRTTVAPSLHHSAEWLHVSVVPAFEKTICTWYTNHRCLVDV